MPGVFIFLIEMLMPSQDAIDDEYLILFSPSCAANKVESV